MTEQGSSGNRGVRFHQPWRTDRRRPQCLQPPPYYTAQGMVDSDRRSYLDRRSAWIRDYQFNSDDGDPQ